MIISDLISLAIPGAVGVAVGHLLVQRLLRRAIPEIANLARRTRNSVYSDLEHVDLPTNVGARRVLLTYPTIVAVFALGVFFHAPMWVIGLLYSVAMPVVIVARYQIAKRYVVPHVRRKLTMLEC